MSKRVFLILACACALGLVVGLGLYGRRSAQGAPAARPKPPVKAQDAAPSAVANSQTFKPGKATAVGVPSSGTEAMKAANRAASELLRARMRRDRPQDFDLLQRVKASEVVVVRGEYDHVETVLTAVKVPHTVIDPADLDTVELNAGQLLLINCPGNLSSTALARVRRFVNAGGFLFTTDWSLQNVLEKAFPGVVEYTRKPTRDDVVEVRVLKKDHTLLQHVRTRGSTPKWWLEGSSYPIRILATAKVEVLMESDEMQRKYGEGPIAITFRQGDGQVLHIVSHFYLQRTETRTAGEKLAGAEFSKSIGFSGVAGAPSPGAYSLARTSAGAVKDAYAAQQLSANVLVLKQKQNAALRKLYAHRSTTAAVLRISPAAASGRVANLRSGTPLKLLERMGNWWKVQTFSGDVGWVVSDRVTRR